MTDQPQLPDLSAVPDKIDLDLDSYHDERDPGPYTFKLGGEIFTMASPAELDYFALVEMVNELEIFPIALGEEQYERLRKHKLTASAAGRLAKAYQEHSGLPEAQSGEGAGSS